MAPEYVPTHRKFRQYRPQVGHQVHYLGKPVGTVTSVEDGMCYRTYPDGKSLPFIWCFRDGLNAMHDWPTKRGGPDTFCPGPRDW